MKVINHYGDEAMNVFRVTLTPVPAAAEQEGISRRCTQMHADKIIGLGSFGGSSCRFRIICVHLRASAAKCFLAARTSRTVVGR